ncbi:MAG TPA: hypothetical protein ENN40_05510 [Candidatus Aminicenantes bacterium]|nr:hypothetical protein [Candidatus Aminicenantes bacterium]
MKQKLMLFAVIMAVVCAGTQLHSAQEMTVELPLGTAVESPAPSQWVFVLPDGQRLELHGSGDLHAGFQKCVLRDPGGKILAQGSQAQFVQPSTEKLLVVPSGIRLIAIDNEVIWARQGAPVPEGSYLRINQEIVWLPAKLHFLTFQTRNAPAKPHKQTGIQPVVPE